jgi:uncharacterized protein (DUF885 family)
MRRHPAIALAVLGVLSASCSSSSPSLTPQPRPGPGADRAPVGSLALEARRKALGDLLHEYWEWYLRQSPERASILGDRRYGDRWDDISPAALADDLSRRRHFLARFQAIDTAGFPEQERLSQRLVVRDLRVEIEGARFESWLMPIDQMGGVHILLPQWVGLFPFDTAEDYEAYIARLRAVPAVFEQAIANARLGMRKGLVPPRVVLERAGGQAAALAGHKPERSPFARPVDRFPSAIPVAEQKRLRAEVLRLVRDRITPAYARLATFIEDEYAPRGRTEAGVWSMPDGAARYAFAVKYFTTTDLTPDQIHALGLREVKRIEAEQAAIGRKLGFENLAAFRKHILDSRRLYARSRQDILDRYRKHLDRMNALLPELFGRLPARKVTVQPIEEFREREFPAGQYIRGTLDGSRQPVVRVNTGDARKRLTVDIEAVAYHEGVPGHHLQIALQQEMTHLPAFRHDLYVGAFIEGWALYAEGLGKEAGLYDDPYSDYGRLQLELLRSIRLVADTGLHARRWTRDQVVRFFREHSTLDEPTVQNETDRYMAIPGQALAYKVGQVTISRLRQDARSRLGDTFDIRAFHDELLGSGPLPLDLLEARIDAWARRQRART